MLKIKRLPEELDQQTVEPNCTVRSELCPSIHCRLAVYGELGGGRDIGEGGHRIV